MQIAADLLEDFLDGAFFVPLAPVTEPSLVPVAIAQTMGLIETGVQPLIEHVKAHLQAKRLLLVLDTEKTLGFSE